MGTMKTTLKIAAAAAGACAALALGSGTASAFTVQPVPGGTQIEVNHGEAVMLSQVRIVGPLLPPLFGYVAQQYIDQAARGNGVAGVTIYGPLQNPDVVQFYHYN